MVFYSSSTSAGIVVNEEPMTDELDVEKWRELPTW